MIRAAAMAAVVALAGCDQGSGRHGASADERRARTPVVDKMDVSLSLGAVNVVHDQNRGVTCWIVMAGQGIGTSCLPDWMLTPAENHASGICGLSASGDAISCDSFLRGAR